MIDIKVLLVSNFRIEEGRGPLFRILNMLPYLIKYCDVVLFSFGEIDPEVYRMANFYNIKVYKTAYMNRGWFVLNSNQIAGNIKKVAIKEKIDLVVLTWEIWDIAVSIYESLKNTNIKYIVTMHSIPFATTLIKTGNFTFDCLKKFLLEKNLMIKKYMLLRNYQAKKYIYSFDILTMTKTVEKKMLKYFPGLNLNLSYPGYAIEVPDFSLNTIDYKYDCIYMAKFEYGKGIFEFIKIVKNMIKFNDKLKFAVVGSFTFDKEKKKFYKMIKKNNLQKNIDCLGWLEGKEKYDILLKSKIFIYPSFIGDTFSQCLLEALAYGKKVVCYDVPFTRDNFDISSVIKIPVFDTKKFALAALKLLNDKNYFSVESYHFVKKNFNSWNDVAKAEYECYRKVVDC